MWRAIGAQLLSCIGEVLHYHGVPQSSSTRLVTDFLEERIIMYKNREGRFETASHVVRCFADLYLNHSYGTWDTTGSYEVISPLGST